MTATPAISVVLPTYNHIRFLPDAIADIVAQTRGDWELIVVDDGSTDETAAWLAATPLDARVRLLRQDNAGPDQAINAGIAQARGDYLTWVSADNRSAPYFLEALAAALDADPAAAVAYSPYYAIDGRDRLQAMKSDNWLLLRELVAGTPRGMAGFLYRRALHDTLGRYEGLACDTRMWARIAEAHACVFVLEPTVHYRFHDDRATVRQHDRVERERRDITRDFLARHAALPPAALLGLLYPGLARAPEHLADAAADAASRLLAAGMAEPALALACEGLRAASPGGLLGPLAGAVAAALRLGGDPVEAVLPALARNPNLTAAARDAALTVAVGLPELLRGLRAAGACSPWLLDAMHPLRRLEAPRVFSYAAWRAGLRCGSLPTF